MVHWGYFAGLYLAALLVWLIEWREMRPAQERGWGLTAQNDELLDENTGLQRNIKSAFSTRLSP